MMGTHKHYYHHIKCKRHSHKVLKKLSYDSTDYVGPMVFDGGSLSRVEIPGGFIAGDSVHAYLYDHQGNVRRVVNTHTGVVEQETHYYPFGMPFGESTATALRALNGSGLQPRRYGGKESVSLGAFTFLDFPARPYDAATARFLTPDPLQEDYTPFSPYLYCMANPMNYTDPTGEDVFILNFEDGEHMAMLIQSENGKWLYYSINGNNVYVSGNHSGGREFNDIGVGEWNSPQEFLNSSYNVRNDYSKDNKDMNHFGFKGGFLIESSPEQDEIMRNKFSKISATEYDLIFNNCTIAVQETLIEANIPVSKPKILPSYIPMSTPYGMVEVYNGTKIKCKINPVPSLAFKSIMKWNPNGKYIRK